MEEAKTNGYRYVLAKSSTLLEQRLKLINRNLLDHAVAEDEGNQRALDQKSSKLSNAIRVAQDLLGTARRETLPRFEREAALRAATKKVKNMAAALEQVKALSRQLPMGGLYPPKS